MYNNIVVDSGHIELLYVTVNRVEAIDVMESCHCIYYNTDYNYYA